MANASAHYYLIGSKLKEIKHYEAIVMLNNVGAD
jgi:hypothetical protein